MKKQIVTNGIHSYTTPDQYVSPKSPAVREHVKWFTGLKLGLMMHWAPGCQLGTFESWPLSDGDGAWSQSDINWTDIETFKQQYIDANKTFNPIKFRPDRWAELAESCGFKYLLFTTKHHDGFCMFDTDTTDYKITDPSCPFHSSPYSDVTRSLCDEFRKRGMAISLYFSKPDWHSDYYWHKDFGTAPTRNVNYSVEEHPKLWENYVSFVHRQIKELCTNYGKVDCLWLDGGWVRPDNLGQDIRLGEIVKKIRDTTQPHLIVCERTAGGEFENIVTPEKQVPEQPMFIPWETCTTIGRGFSFHYTDEFKSGRELVSLLLDVVCRGGNLALNIAPQPDGELPAPAVTSMRELGRWLNIHKDGIYETEPAAPFFNRDIRYTCKKDTLFAFHVYKDCAKLPSRLHLEVSQKVNSVTLMRTGQDIPFIQDEKKLLVDTDNINMNEAFYADCFVIR